MKFQRYMTVGKEVLERVITAIKNIVGALLYTLQDIYGTGCFQHAIGFRDLSQGHNLFTFNCFVKAQLVRGQGRKRVSRWQGRS